jgi:HCOMODA/2-hydroxy-3-carboxy-muconic semialdehyde decarboxylase
MANRILAAEGVVDAFGHISVRHPDRPDRYLLSCSRSPELVKVADIMEFDLDSNPVDAKGRTPYLERFIHGAVYRARPDVMSAMHNHSYEIIPFGVKAGAADLPSADGSGAPSVWDIRKKFGDTTCWW